jgi:MFS family permease
VLAGGIIAALHVGKVPPALDALRAELGLGMVSASFIVSTFNVLGMSLGLLAGVLADRIGRRRLVGLGLLSMALGGLLGTLGGGYAGLLAGRVFEGLGFVAVSVASPALLLAATAPTDRSLALSIWSVFMPAGMALALVASPWALEAEAVGWRGLWLGIAVVALIGAVAVRRATAGLTVHAPPAGPSWRVLGETLTRPGLLLLGAIFGAYAFQWVAVMVWLPTFLPAALGVASDTAARLTALVVAMNVPGNLLGGWLLRRGVPAARLMMAVAAVMAACAWGLFSPTLPESARFALVLLFSGAGGIIPAALFASMPAQAPSPRHLGAANGMLMQGSNIGQFLGPPLIAASVTAAGGAWTGAIAPALTAAALCALAAGLSGRHAARRAQVP